MGYSHITINIYEAVSEFVEIGYWPSTRPKCSESFEMHFSQDVRSLYKTLNGQYRSKAQKHVVRLCVRNRILRR